MHGVTARELHAEHHHPEQLPALEAAIQSTTRREPITATLATHEQHDQNIRQAVEALHSAGSSAERDRRLARTDDPRRESHRRRTSDGTPETSRADPAGGRHGGADEHLPAPAAQHQRRSTRCTRPAARAAGPSRSSHSSPQRGLTAFVRPGRGGPRLYYLTLAGAQAVEMIPTRVETRRKLITPEQAAGPLWRHTLAVNDVGIAFMRAARERGDDFGAVRLAPRDRPPRTHPRARSRRAADLRRPAHLPRARPDGRADVPLPAAGARPRDRPHRHARRQARPLRRPLPPRPDQSRRSHPASPRGRRATRSSPTSSASSPGNPEPRSCAARRPSSRSATQTPNCSNTPEVRVSLALLEDLQARRAIRPDLAPAQRPRPSASTGSATHRGQVANRTDQHSRRRPHPSPHSLRQT